jgi:hypothetical protein
VQAILQIEHDQGSAVTKLLEHGRNHHRAEARGVSGNHEECDLEGQPHTDEAIVKRGMSDGRGILASDQIEYEIQRREHQDAPNGSDPKYDLGEFHLVP